MMIFATHASSAVATEKAAEEASAITYCGPSDFGHKYGVLPGTLADAASEQTVILTR